MNELIQAYAQGYDQLTEALNGVSEELLHFKPAPDKWSIKEVIIHVSDAEMIAIYRMKKIIAENNPLLFKFDPDAWAGRLKYESLDLQHYLELFKLQRAGMTAVLKGLQPDDWERTGVHNIAGKQTLKDIVSMFVGHVSRHIQQIERNKQAFQSRI
ncbi:DinB family protein [Paenibacillus piri]|nr:DinB family protein [Paenibacillus piri]